MASFWLYIYGHYPGKSVLVNLLDISGYHKLVENCIYSRMEDSEQLESVYNVRFVLRELNSDKKRERLLERLRRHTVHIFFFFCRELTF